MADSDSGSSFLISPPPDTGRQSSRSPVRIAFFLVNFVGGLLAYFAVVSGNAFPIIYDATAHRPEISTSHYCGLAAALFGAAFFFIATPVLALYLILEATAFYDAYFRGRMQTERVLGSLIVPTASLCLFLPLEFGLPLAVYFTACAVHRLATPIT